MAKFREGQTVELAGTVHSGGSGYRGDRGRVVKVYDEAWGGDRYDVRLDSGVIVERVRDGDLYPA